MSASDLSPSEKALGILALVMMFVAAVFAAAVGGIVFWLLAVVGGLMTGADHQAINNAAHIFFWIGFVLSMTCALAMFWAALAETAKELEKPGVQL